MNVVVVGKNSFIARELKKAAPDWIYLGHDEINFPQLKAADLIINFAFPPEFKTAYDAASDVDIKLAQANPKTRYIMISSRAVYGLGGDECFKEGDNTNPASAYAYSKQETESALYKILGDKLTILRPSNIFGMEKGRPTFLGQALKTLASEGKIILNIDPKSKKDFLPVGRFAEILVKIAAAPKAGIFNIGSGVPVEVGQVAEWLIEGYGGGDLVVTNSANDSFCLDMTKTSATYGIAPCTIDRLRADCIACGQALRA